MILALRTLRTTWLHHVSVFFTRREWRECQNSNHLSQSDRVSLSVSVHTICQFGWVGGSTACIAALYIWVHEFLKFWPTNINMVNLKELAFVYFLVRVRVQVWVQKFRQVIFSGLNFMPSSRCVRLSRYDTIHLLAGTSTTCYNGIWSAACTSLHSYSSYI